MGGKYNEQDGSINCSVCSLCGGCCYTDTAYDKELEKKYKNVSGLFKDYVECQPIVGMYRPVFYRNKVHGVVGRGREIVTGIYQEGTHRLVPVDKCMIEDQKADLELSIGDSVFSGCLFENVRYQSWQVQSDITNCRLTNLNFKNIQIEGDICFVGLEMSGGKIEHFNFSGNQILQNDFYDMHMSDVNINGALIKNKMKKCEFKNVMSEGYNKDNTYIECVN